VFIFFTSILFAPAVAPWILVTLYAGSFLVILLMGLSLNGLGVGGRAEPFIMEIPPYRLPTPGSIALRTWQELKEFL